MLTKGAGASDDPIPRFLEVGAGTECALLRHGRVLALESEEQRIAVSELWRSLELGGRRDEEDPVGLFDCPGALIRYLRARKWDVCAAEEAIRATARWRRGFDFAGLRDSTYASRLRELNASGTLYVRGFDLHGRPLIYTRTQDVAGDVDDAVRHLVYCVERAVACVEFRERAALAAGSFSYDQCTGKFVLVADMNTPGLPSFALARAVIGVLQDHYPERLGKAVILNPPAVFSWFCNGVRPFLDPVTAAKFLTLSGGVEDSAYRAELGKLFDLDLLEEELGGLNSTPFDSDVFMSVQRDGSEFGLEFDEQLSLADGSGLRPFSSARSRSFWAVCSDPALLALPARQRSLVRQLARDVRGHTGAAGAALRESGLGEDAAALVRFLRAARWRPQRAASALLQTARWRAAFGLNQASASDAASCTAAAREAAAGRIFVRGSDTSGRPLMCFRPGLPSTSNGQGFLWHFVLCVERACSLADDRCGLSASSAPGAGEFALLVDFTDYNLRCRPALHAMYKAAKALSNHYPGRLGAVYMVEPPARIALCWRALSRFVLAEPSTSEARVVLPSTSALASSLLASAAGVDGADTSPRSWLRVDMLVEMARTVNERASSVYSHIAGAREN